MTVTLIPADNDRNHALLSALLIARGFDLWHLTSLVYSFKNRRLIRTWKTNQQMYWYSAQALSV